jgi:hypothetical protein
MTRPPSAGKLAMEYKKYPGGRRISTAARLAIAYKRDRRHAVRAVASIERSEM